MLEIYQPNRFYTSESSRYKLSVVEIRNVKTVPDQSLCLSKTTPNSCLKAVRQIVKNRARENEFTKLTV